MQHACNFLKQPDNTEDIFLNIFHHCNTYMMLSKSTTTCDNSNTQERLSTSLALLSSRGVATVHVPSPTVLDQNTRQQHCAPISSLPSLPNNNPDVPSLNCRSGLDLYINSRDPSPLNSTGRHGPFLILTCNIGLEIFKNSDRGSGHF